MKEKNEAIFKSEICKEEKKKENNCNKKRHHATDLSDLDFTSFDSNDIEDILGDKMCFDVECKGSILRKDISKKEEPRLSFYTKFPVETRFCIDNFNRFRGSESKENTSSPIKMNASEHRIIARKAKSLILKAFENLDSVINLEYLQLTAIPDEIKDFNNLVFLEDRPEKKFQLYLTGNRLRILPPSLFNFTRLLVLCLRNNRLSEIPPLIGKLVELTDLSLGSNKLKFLPREILNLHKLKTLSVGCNPFFNVSDDAICIESGDTGASKQLRYISNVNYFFQKQQFVPSLKFLCLNEIAKYDMSFQELVKWNEEVPSIHHDLMKQIVIKSKYGYTCSECEMILVTPYADVIEWWEILNNKNISIKKEFCCEKCVNKWKKKIEFYRFNNLV